jgi:hypothetical protein
MLKTSDSKIALVALIALAVWLLICLPLIYLPNASSTWIETAQRWQTLIASCVAIVAAIIAWTNTSRTLKANSKLELQRRQQKHRALRAVLPLSLSEISLYCSRTAHVLETLWGECIDEALPKKAEIKPTFPPLPTETVRAFVDFIEYSDELETSLFRTMLARLQVSRARNREIETFFESEDRHMIILENNIEEYILDAAAIYAASAAAFDYGREKTHSLPSEITWDRVRSALRNMKIWDDDLPELYAMIARQEEAGLLP